MFFLPFWTLNTWLVLGGSELAPTLITNVDWMMCILCTHLTYRVLCGVPRKRETSDWLKARFKLLCLLTPILHYFHLLGLPLEQIVMIDWWSMLCMLIHWYHSHIKRFRPHQALWHPSRLKFYGNFENSFKKSRLNRRRARKSILPLLAYVTISSKQSQVTAYASTESGPLLHRFDSDSKPWLIDNCSTACISNNKGDFVGKLHTVNTQVKGIEGLMIVTLRGTLKWSSEDDQGATHTFLIPDSGLLLRTNFTRLPLLIPTLGTDLAIPRQP
jgi:hypothetical protein